MSCITVDTPGHIFIGKCRAEMDRLPGKCALIRFATGSTLTAPVEHQHVLYACVGIGYHLQGPGRHFSCKSHGGMWALTICKLMLNAKDTVDVQITSRTSADAEGQAAVSDIKIAVIQKASTVKSLSSSWLIHCSVKASSQHGDCALDQQHCNGTKIWVRIESVALLS